MSSAADNLFVHGHANLRFPSRDADVYNVTCRPVSIMLLRTYTPTSARSAGAFHCSLHTSTFSQYATRAQKPLASAPHVFLFQRHPRPRPPCAHLLQDDVRAGCWRAGQWSGTTIKAIPRSMHGRSNHRRGSKVKHQSTHTPSPSARHTPAALLTASTRGPRHREAGSEARQFHTQTSQHREEEEDLRRISRAVLGEGVDGDRGHGDFGDVNVIEMLELTKGTSTS